MVVRGAEACEGYATKKDDVCPSLRRFFEALRAVRRFPAHDECQPDPTDEEKRRVGDYVIKILYPQYQALIGEAVVAGILDYRSVYIGQQEDAYRHDYEYHHTRRMLFPKHMPHQFPHNDRSDNQNVDKYRVICSPPLLLN